MIIPPEKLTEEVLKNLLESYITREGTDYGERELSLEDKVAELLPLVYKGEVIISYDDVSDSVNVLLPQDIQAEDNSADS
ncbi:YheU family protein [Teredinibacter purpureus]|uniref:YheU family protein n=1 Tax=Teredinibacter purpureus TaxID=2731756 RepID=UPI0005F85D33|nr:YheU family protein [Teredinibacter purpureus]